MSCIGKINGDTIHLGRGMGPKRQACAEAEASSRYAHHSPRLFMRVAGASAGGAGLAPLGLAGERPALAPGSRLPAV